MASKPVPDHVAHLGIVLIFFVIGPTAVALTGAWLWWKERKR